MSEIGFRLFKHLRTGLRLIALIGLSDSRPISW